MSDELDDPRVLKRFAISILVGLASALAGALLTFAVRPIVDLVGLTVFTGWGAFLWIELGAIISGSIGFVLCWKRIKN
jgi:hypothetical protein